MLKNKKDFMKMCEELFAEIQEISVAVIYDCETTDILYANSWGTRLEAELDAQVELFKAYHEHDIDTGIVRAFVLDATLNLKKIFMIREIDGLKTFKMDFNSSKMSEEYRQKVLDYLEEKVNETLENIAIK